MNALLKTISEQASEDLRDLIEEGAEDIHKAILKAEEEAQANDTKPKFALGFKITVDLDKATYNCDLSWTIKQVLSTSHTINDPDQEKLPMEDDTTVTISGAGKSVTMSGKEFSEAANKIVGK